MERTFYFANVPEFDSVAGEDERDSVVERAFLEGSVSADVSWASEGVED